MDNDRALVKKAQKNIKDFDDIYINYAAKIRNYFRPKVSNDDFAADDLTSQTFEKAIRNIGKFKWKGISFSAWLYTIANNTLIDFYRKNKKIIHIDEDYYGNLKDESPLIEEEAIDDDTSKRIKQILDALPQREKDVLKLKFYEGLNNKEIGQRLELSETNVGTIIYRSTKKLKEALESSNLSPK